MKDEQFEFAVSVMTDQLEPSRMSITLVNGVKYRTLSASIIYCRTAW